MAIRIQSVIHKYVQSFPTTTARGVHNRLEGSGGGRLRREDVCMYVCMYIERLCALSGAWSVWVILCGWRRETGRRRDRGGKRAFGHMLALCAIEDTLFVASQPHGSSSVTPRRTSESNAQPRTQYYRSLLGRVNMKNGIFECMTPFFAPGTGLHWRGDTSCLLGEHPRRSCPKSRQ